MAAAEYLMELLQYSPPDILSMSWYERIRPYAAGEVAMAYGYTLLAPYFELDPASPPHGQTGYLPHPAGPEATPVAPVGGYVLGIPAT
jgi:multiple sugar transport system substrate-binding protein